MGIASVSFAAFPGPAWRVILILNRLAFLPVALLMATSLFLLLSQDWRRFFIAIAVQYLCVFWLVALVWPVGLAAVKLVVGWMCAAVLGASQIETDLEDQSLVGSSGWLFMLVAAGVVWLVVFSVSSTLQDWIPASSPMMFGGLVLIGMGLLQLGMHNNPLRVIVGLLTLISGFEILYAVIENSVLVAGLLALINLGLSLIGSYLQVYSPEEANPE